MLALRRDDAKRHEAAGQKVATGQPCPAADPKLTKVVHLTPLGTAFSMDGLEFVELLGIDRS